MMTIITISHGIQMKSKNVVSIEKNSSSTDYIDFFYLTSVIMIGQYKILLLFSKFLSALGTE